MSSSCSEFTLFETDFQCVDGIITNFRKEINITIGDWILYSEEGNCECLSSSSSSSETPEPSSSSSETPEPSSSSSETPESSSSSSETPESSSSSSETPESSSSSSETPEPSSSSSETPPESSSSSSETPPESSSSSSETPPESSSSSSETPPESSSSSGEVITTSCCENGIPATLYLHVVEVFTACNPPNSIPLIWNGFVWDSGCIEIDPFNCPDCWTSFQVTCDNGSWLVNSGSTDISSCNPFLLNGVLDVWGTFSNCFGSECDLIIFEYQITDSQ